MEKGLISIILAIFIGAVSLVSCSSTDDNGLNNDGVDDTDLKDVLKDVCLDWDASVATIVDKMSGYDEIWVDGETMTYSNKERTVLVSYKFDYGALVAAMVAFNMPLSGESVENRLKGYKYLGILDGNSVYVHEGNNTMCCSSIQPFDDIEYTVFGFTPGKSEYFDRFEPVSIGIDAIKDVTSSAATIKCTLVGISGDAVVGIVVSDDEDFSSKKLIKGSYSNGVATINVKNLTHDSKYWCYAYVTIDGITYKSNPTSFETAHEETYSIGDVYYSNGRAIGIVFYTTDGGLHGKIVSLTQKRNVKWDVNGAFSSNAGCRNASDGSYNHMPNSSSPVASWISDLGAGWYCPARGELVTLAKQAKQVNVTMSNVGGDIIEGFYWSSTEYLSDTAYIVCVASTGYMGYEPGWYGYNTKDVTRSALGVKKF